LSGFISKKQVVDTVLNIARSAGKKAGQKLLILRVRNWLTKNFIKTCVFSASARASRASAGDST